ncbi:unnamed protein product [Parnassius apollo]|uniref:(apollo) hypothetical protein n=1 Tax=Parnassius apollo TaxID=110799 RepID=A0A8S3Y1T9_PARAO|nr:unnamed protein product [Parnassius apollo]
MTSNEKFMKQAVVVLQRIKILGCMKCPVAFSNMGDYKLHKLKHDLENIRKRRQEKSKKYYQSNKEGFEKKIQCDECDMKFVERSTLEAHSALHKPFPHVCDCGVGFYVYNDLKCHMELVHADEDGVNQSKVKNQKKNKKIQNQKENMPIRSNKRTK